MARMKRSTTLRNRNGTWQRRVVEKKAAPDRRSDAASKRIAEGGNYWVSIVCSTERVFGNGIPRKFGLFEPPRFIKRIELVFIASVI